MTLVLVTGATGFVGQAFCAYLLDQGYLVKAVGRNPEFPFSHPNLQYYRVENIDAHTDWDPILPGVNVIVHLAAKVHDMQNKGMRALRAYQKINVKGTQHLAQSALKHDVKRFVFISSVKVLGERTLDTPLRAEDRPHARDAYSLSKLQAENVLRQCCRRSGMEWVIIRPPLIYGPCAKGNFEKLLKLAKTRFVLPFGSISNKRSLVSLPNLCSFIECCIRQEHAHNEVYLVSDNEDVSTADLIRLIRKALGRRAFLLPFPVALLRFAALLLGQRHQMSRLVDPLQVNIEKSMRFLNWHPPFSVEASIKWLLEEEKNPFSRYNGRFLLA